jgi:ribonucleoside-diphosphate reductase alpha chain
MTVADHRTAIGLNRHFTTADVHPYDQVKWERRDARITNWKDGSVAFEQLGVEVPADWSVNATNILAQKYFRGTPGTPEREWSFKQVVDRVADTVTNWGTEGGYFADEDEAEAFRNELKYILVTQRAAFNSPVWFNIGVEGVPQQASACFILSVDDDMNSILNWYKEEGIIFKGGSGAGVNLSKIRSSAEILNGGGSASGPVSFMRGADASAGTIKSGGKCIAPWTKVYTAEKGPVEVQELAKSGQDFITVSYNPLLGRVQACTARAWQSGHKKLVKVVTDKGEFTMSSDHPVLLMSGGYRAAEALTPGMSIRPATVVIQENGYHRIGMHDGNKGKMDIHRLVAQDVMGYDIDGMEVHHKDRNRANNAPENLEVLPRGEHIGIHAAEDFAAGTHPFLRFHGEGNHPAVSGNGNGMSFASGNRTEAYRENQIAGMRREGVYVKGHTAAARQRMMNKAYEVVNSGGSIDSFEEYFTGRRSLAGKMGYSKAEQQAKIEERFGSYEAFRDEVRANNHRVVAIEELGYSDVYDVEVDNDTPRDKSEQDGHNFMIVSETNNQQGFTGIFVSNTRRAAKMVILDVDHPDVEEFIWCKALEERKARALRDAGFDMDLDGRDSFSIQYQNANNSVRVTDEFMQAVVDDADWHLRAVKTGEIVKTVRARDLMRQFAEATWECADPGMQFDTTINRWHTAANTDRINGSNPCSEYMHVDNSACNLASLNLMKFLNEDGTFDVVAFRHSVEIMFTAQEILVDNADYPTPAIGENTRKFRQLGLGYANIGAVLMALGMPYDSDAGRAWAGAITALMTGHAYATSARTSARLGPFAGYVENEEHMLRVLGMHRDAVKDIDATLVPSNLLNAAQASWDAACEIGADHGVRNAQATVLAPTGTIGLLMDCDTTGIEPDLGLVKMKKLVGGGTMMIVNQTVSRALKNLGYDEKESADIIAYIDEHKSILGAPHLKADHVDVFACSMGDNTIHYSGHVRMMAAAQPFLSGAISKTVNLPEEATVEEIEQLHIDAWKMGVKAIAVYRDNCKVGQPLSTAKKAGASDDAVASEAVELVERVVEKIVNVPERARLPRARQARTFEFRVADCKGFITVGEYDDGRPGEIFVRVSKQGSTLAGIVDALSVAVSHGLQYGVPMRSYVKAFTGMRFEPAGMTDDPDIRIANSLIDYLFRKLALIYLTRDERHMLNIYTTEERTAAVAEEPKLPIDEDGDMIIAETVVVEEPTVDDEAFDFTVLPEGVRHSDAPLCMLCGVQMVRSGSCHACPSCGTTSGCS